MCSQDILDDSSWGPQNGFFGFSLGGYPEGGALLPSPSSFTGAAEINMVKVRIIINVIFIFKFFVNAVSSSHLVEGLRMIFFIKLFIANLILFTAQAGQNWVNLVLVFLL